MDLQTAEGETQIDISVPRVREMGVSSANAYVEAKYFQYPVCGETPWDDLRCVLDDSDEMIADCIQLFERSGGKFKIARENEWIEFQKNDQILSIYFSSLISTHCKTLPHSISISSSPQCTTLPNGPRGSSRPSLKPAKLPACSSSPTNPLSRVSSPRSTAAPPSSSISRGNSLLPKRPARRSRRSAIFRAFSRARSPLRRRRSSPPRGISKCTGRRVFWTYVETWNRGCRRKRCSRFLRCRAR